MINFQLIHFDTCYTRYLASKHRQSVGRKILKTDAPCLYQSYSYPESNWDQDSYTNCLVYLLIYWSKKADNPLNYHPPNGIDILRIWHICIQHECNQKEIETQAMTILRRTKLENKATRNSFCKIPEGNQTNNYLSYFRLV